MHKTRKATRMNPKRLYIWWTLQWVNSCSRTCAFGHGVITYVQIYTIPGFDQANLHLLPRTLLRQCHLSHTNLQSTYTNIPQTNLLPMPQHTYRHTVNMYTIAISNWGTFQPQLQQTKTYETEESHFIVPFNLSFSRRRHMRLKSLFIVLVLRSIA